ncbi:MAG TPA: hypothetical protein VFB33_05560 [Candidatus Binataceae bacterium]|nr:hypothetical protein [Candidatus Binataceae bacterium]
MLPWDGAYVYTDPDAVEKYVTVAIFIARDGYRDPRWRRWAENWLSGRDRSYRSAQLAYRRARQLWSREITDGLPLVAAKWAIEQLSDELPAERAARAARLALLAAPIGPDLRAALLRFTAAVSGASELFASSMMREWAALRVGWDALCTGLRVGQAPQPVQSLAAAA